MCCNRNSSFICATGIAFCSNHNVVCTFAVSHSSGSTSCGFFGGLFKDVVKSNGTSSCRKAVQVYVSTSQKKGCRAPEHPVSWHLPTPL